MSLMVRLHLVSFLLLGSFGVAAPAAQSLFLGAFPAELLPWAWLAVTCGSVGVVAALRGAGRRWDAGRCFAAALAVSALVLVALLCGERAGMAAARFGLYVWRDLYIIVTLELFWTLVGVTAVARRASRAYGWLCASGTLGGVVASLATARVPASLGEAGALWAVLPLLAGAGLLGRRVLAPTPMSTAAAGRGGAAPSRSAAADAAGLAPRERAPAGPVATAAADARPRPAMTPAILRVLLLVALSHLALTVLDYRFNQAVQLAYTDRGERLRAVGHVQAAIKGVSLLLQVTAHWSLRVMGLPLALLATPAAMVLALSAQMFGGGMAALTAAKVLGKSTDYALFRAAKEMLYVPLSYAEKTGGKAVVDILGSRAIKGGTSLMLITMVAAGAGGYVADVGLAAAAAWAVFSWPLTASWPPSRRGRPPGGGGD